MKSKPIFQSLTASPDTMAGHQMINELSLNTQLLLIALKFLLFMGKKLGALIHFVVPEAIRYIHHEMHESFPHSQCGCQSQGGKDEKHKHDCVVLTGGKWKSL